MERLVAMALLGVVGSGCVAAGEEDGSAAWAAPSKEPEALNLNALNLNALNLSALNLNALNSSALSVDAAPAILDPSPNGDLARQLIKYAVGCALKEGETFSFSWTSRDGAVHNVTYQGLLGLAPNWTSTPLSLEDAQWVSACIASRVNWYTIPVLISSRGVIPALDHPDADEVATFVNKEGAFWGNLFSDNPALFACYYEPNVDHSRGMLRDCAVGHVNDTGSVVDCGAIQIVGSCDVVCEPPGSPSLYYPACGAPVVVGSGASSDAAKTPIVVTVFLQ